MNKKWAGLLVAPNQVMFLETYPLISLERIEFETPEEPSTPRENGGA